MNDFNGVIILNKPRGSSSHRMVSIVRRALDMKKIGHTGTLDPGATGVLPILVGTATRASDLLTAQDKRYRATVLLGTVTDTLDTDGKVIAENPVNAAEADIRRSVSAFVGNIEQLPPMFSAVQVGGQRLYHLARQGIEIERKPRSVTIYSIDILSIDIPRVTIDVHCSKGTYIRTLAADIGDKLGCGACIESLTRTQSGDFLIENSVTPEQLSALSEKGEAESVIIPTDKLFPDYETVQLDKKRADRVKNGVPIYFGGKDFGQKLRIYDENGNFIALSEVSETDGRKCLKLIKGFYK